LKAPESGLIFLARLLFVFAWLSLPAHAGGIAEQYPQVQSYFPQADSFGELTGTPPAAEVRQRGKLLGYVYLSGDVLKIPAYSGRPINNLVGFDTHGRITGVAIVFHEEPILLAGISEERLGRFVQQYPGKNLFDDVAVGGDGLDGRVSIDTISGATITVMVENATIMRSGRQVASSRGITLVDMKPAHAPVLAQRAAPGHEAARHARERAQDRAEESAEKHHGAVAATSMPPLQDEPLWKKVWRQRLFQIGVLGAGLFFLSLVLVFQDWLARHPSLLIYVRDGFLLYTIFFIGWYGMAQLSVVNVLTFTHSIISGFSWESFLIDPMMFMLWSFVAMTLLLWGRGVYCGWLCPYGALQELVNQVSTKWLKLRQWEFPDVVHERLWAVKYIILMALFGLSLQSLSAAERYAEVEPFKTAIVMRFQREWAYVFYAVGLLAISAVNRKFFCKYLCPLGAALTIPARFRIFNWLRRRKECGSPCQVCAKECEVRAINSIGEINANECHYCLDCQVTYYNEHKCPPMVDRRKRREKGVRAREVLQGMESVIGASGLENIEVRQSSACDDCTQGCKGDSG
jgi:hypothetical protein